MFVFTWLDAINSVVSSVTERQRVEAENWTSQLLFHRVSGAQYVQVEVGYNEPSASYDADVNSIQLPIGTVVGNDVLVSVCLDAAAECHEVNKNNKIPMDYNCPAGTAESCTCVVTDQCFAVSTCLCLDVYATSEPSVESSDPFNWGKQ